MKDLFKSIVVVVGYVVEKMMHMGNALFLIMIVYLLFLANLVLSLWYERFRELETFFIVICIVVPMIIIIEIVIFVIRYFNEKRLERENERDRRIESLHRMRIATLKEIAELNLKRARMKNESETVVNEIEDLY